MFTPQFPYLGNQVIISSGRVVHHSSDDFVMLFGKKGVAVSSPATFTVDANERTIFASPKIELGYQAESKGEPVLLGSSTVLQLGFVLDAIKELSKAINKLTAEEPEKAISDITKASKVLTEIAGTVKAQLKTTCLSKNTYTK
jgi:hypothetical protein